VAGDGKVFCLDKAPSGVTGALKRRGTKLTGTARLLAFDIHTGRPHWEHLENVFGTWLGYSAEYDILLQSGRDSRDMLKDEVKQGMIAFQGKTGAQLWKNNARYSGPCILYHDTIITDPNQYNLLNGEQIQQTNPITHEEYPWAFKRNYGCNYTIAGEHFLAFRSGAAGFFDLENNAGTGNFGGFKSGCTSNLIAAGGVLNAPDYTRTCSCSYQNQTSLALYHDPSVEIWTFNIFSLGEEKAIQRLGLNLGAPGDRVDHDGTLWLEFPVNDSPSPDLYVDIQPENPRWFVHHSSRYAEHDLRWVGASGAEDIRQLTIHVASDQKQRTYTVTLLFADPGYTPAAQNTFSVDVQGQTVLRDFNIATEANGVRRTIKRVFTAIEATETIKIDLTPSQPGNHTLLCGVEIIAESINEPCIQTALSGQGE